MTRAPYVMLKPEEAFSRGQQTIWDTTLGWRMINPKLAETYQPCSLGETAENVAREYGISRGNQDELALRSHLRSIAAQDACRFSREIVPIETPQRRGETIV